MEVAEALHITLQWVDPKKQLKAYKIVKNFLKLMEWERSHSAADSRPTHGLKARDKV